MSDRLPVDSRGDREIVVRADGAARGNPGPASFGVVIEDPDGRVLLEAGAYLGIATNNVAEYKALLAALRLLPLLTPARVVFRLDSELIVRQIAGSYRVKDAKLLPLHREAKILLGNLPPWTMVHVPRAQNAAADRLANLAIDRYNANVGGSATGDRGGRKALEESPGSTGQDAG